MLAIQEGNMNYQRPLIATLLAVVFLSTIALGFTSPATAQDKEQTTKTTDAAKTPAPVGFPTGTICTNTGTYRAENKFLRVVIVVAEGEEFPPFTDGEKTLWYALTPSTKSTFEAVKTTTDPN